jgi:hypothetical protein
MPSEKTFQAGRFCRTFAICTTVFLFFLGWSGPANLKADITDNTLREGSGETIGTLPTPANPALFQTEGKLYLPLIQKNFNPALYTLVPDLAGLTQTEAEADILAAELTPGNVTQGSSPTIPSGKVKSQNPTAGLYAAKGSAVDLVISTGPAILTVPSVYDKLQAEAEGLITAAGLLVGMVTRENSGTVPQGHVISQSPPAGTSVVEGTHVDLVISSGPAQAAVPDLYNQLQTEAEGMITAAGLAVGTVQPEYSELTAGHITRQWPAAPGDPARSVHGGASA